ncbi:hypothetical protein ACFQ88_22915 [Paenibacillus sp. NPDC056579]|uniref:hypothetical protein n=1 Tax=Paenibacillus sp. NPDC056579 TaxID=3345871 RepID=UPI0036888A56
MNKTTLLLLLMVMIVMLTACSRTMEGDAPQVKPGDVKPKEPVTIRIAWLRTPEDAKKVTEHPYIKEKFPYVTFEYMTANPDAIQKEIAGGISPDLIELVASTIPPYNEMGLMTDNMDLVRKFKVNLGKYIPGDLETIKAYNLNGELYGLPAVVPQIRRTA